MKILSTIFMFMVLMACGTTDGSLKEQGKTEAYIQGFHDGRHSGMKEEGNHYEHFIKDEARFAGDPDYKSGWLAGEVEGKALQDQAVSIGNAAAGAYSGSQISKETRKNSDMDKVARDAVKGVDTTGMDSLGK
jgi:hypothetical protein